MLTRRIDISPGEGDSPPDDLLAREWLLTNGRGSFAASTILGVNTRKYHGLLVASVDSPGERFVLLSRLSETLELAGETFELGCAEFDGLFHPDGWRRLVGFEQDVAAGCVTFEWDLPGALLRRSLVLARDADALAVRYELEGAAAGSATLRVQPFFACRHYHANRHAGDPDDFRCERDAKSGEVRLTSRPAGLPAVVIRPAGGAFESGPDYWRNFFYRAEAERGEDPHEDLFTPGAFELRFGRRGRSELSIAAEPFEPLGFDAAHKSQKKQRSALLKGFAAGPLGPADDPRVASDPGRTRGPRGADAFHALVLAADDFVAVPPMAAGAKQVATILAGFPWFADWGRDAFIALPGLLLATGRAQLAHGVLRRFAGAIRNGLLPNRFTDEPFEPFEPGRPGPGAGSRPGPGSAIGCDYNSVDAGLWFIRAAYAWAEHTGKWDDLHAELMTPIRSILEAYHHGTDYHIGVGSDGLLACGSGMTQLTWMDAMADGTAVTPRPGKPVEVNALYGHALRLTADRLRRRGDEEAGVYRARYEKWAHSFVTRFVSPRGGLCDCIAPDGRPDEAIRPNQVIAASLPGSPLPIELRREVVRIAAEQLLTPFGLRSLAPGEPGYRGQCVGPRAQRDRAYHQGTVWAWLIGPFIEAHLAVNDFSQDAKQQAASWLEPLLGHLGDAGLGQVSEIFDGDPPHTPRGCFAQAWSVAELLRSLAMIRTYRPERIVQVK